MVVHLKAFARRARVWEQRLCVASKTLLYAHGMLSTDDLCLPDFLCIGAQKGGTTWLFTNLAHHPEIFIPQEPPHCDLHYFDLSAHKGLRYYADKFAPGCHKVKGESTPAYAVMPLAHVRFVRAVLPDVRLIFMLRNPIDRAWSHALMGLVARRKRILDQVDEAEFYAHFTSRRSRERGDYLSSLDYWLSVFPEEQLLVGFFDDIAIRPRELLAEVFAHIGVSMDVEWDAFPYNKVINKGPSIAMPDRYRDFLENMYCREIEILHARFGAPIAGWRCL